MVRVGTNIGFYPTREHLALLDRVDSVDSLRFVPRLDSDDTWLIQELLTRGITPWLVFDKGALDGGVVSALQEYKRRYLDLGVVWQIGNEPDIESPSSWTMSQDVFSLLLQTARNVLGPDAYIVSGGLASGQPGWLGGVDLSAVNAIAIHPYGKWPSDAPVRGGWGFGPVLPLIQGYRDQLDQMGLGHLAMHVSEYGAPRTELGDSTFAQYTQDMTRALASSPLLGTILQFCLTDKDVPPFGLFDVNGQPKATLPLGAPVPKPIPNGPRFVLGFKDWHDHDPALIGEPVEDEWGATQGISQQRTTHGILTWAGLRAGDVMTFLDTRDGRRYRYTNGRSQAA
jgi:hypothetical protein